jgi:hypothetical protein
LKLQERLAELGKAKHPHMGSARHP